MELISGCPCLEPKYAAMLVCAYAQLANDIPVIPAYNLIARQLGLDSEKVEDAFKSHRTYFGPILKQEEDGFYLTNSKIAIVLGGKRHNYYPKLTSGMLYDLSVAETRRFLHSNLVSILRGDDPQKVETKKEVPVQKSEARSVPNNLTPRCLTPSKAKALIHLWKIWLKGKVVLFDGESPLTERTYRDLARMGLARIEKEIELWPSSFDLFYAVPHEDEVLFPGMRFNKVYSAASFAEQVGKNDSSILSVVKWTPTRKERTCLQMITDSVRKEILSIRDAEAQYQERLNREKGRR